MRWKRWMGVGVVVLTAFGATSTGCDKLRTNKEESTSGKKSGEGRGKHAKASDDEASDDNSDPKAVGEKKGAVKGSAPSSQPQASATNSAAAVAAPALPDTASPQPAAGGRSPVPTQDEWRAVTKEVTVRGSGALSCETKMLREWLRVSCRDKNPTGGTPTGVSVTSGGGQGDDFAFASGGVTSLVVRFVEGVSIDAVFTWTDESRTLHIVWPRGAPEPADKGVFDGGRSAPASAGGRRKCHVNRECAADSVCMPDGFCHLTVDVQ